MLVHEDGSASRTATLYLGPGYGLFFLAGKRCIRTLLAPVPLRGRAALLRH